jgi:hypothetical protein
MRVGHGPNPDAGGVNVDTEIAKQRELIAELQTAVVDATGINATQAVEAADALRTAIEGLRVLAEIEAGPLA